MTIFNNLIALSTDFKSIAALNDKQKTVINQLKPPHHSFSDKAMGGVDKHRIEIPLKPLNVIPPKVVVKALKNHGYVKFNYTKGIVKDKYGRETKIGKTLTKHNEHEALKTYINDPKRNAINDEHKIVITRHPHDVAAMSTNQGWTSCLNMEDGSHNNNIPNEVKHGTHVAYLVHKDDNNLERPIARIALKPFVSDKGKKVLRPESKIYGTANSNFHKTVSNWVKQKFPVKDAVYKKHPEVYDDDSKDTIGTGKYTEWDNKYYYKNSKLHRDGDLPAVEFGNIKEYYKNGKLHRDGDLPAIESNDGYKAYYKNGILHRDGDLPAIEHTNGDKEYYKNGKLHRDGDKPAVENVDGTKAYYKNGKLHRGGDKPAIEHANGDKEYWKNGQRHRYGDLPAIENVNGHKEYY